MRRFGPAAILGLVGLLLAVAVLPAEAKSKRRTKAKPAKSSVLRGPIPKLPNRPVQFDVASSGEEELFAEAVTGTPLEVTTAAAHVAPWTLAQWREQMHRDVAALARERDGIAERYDALNRGAFAVAARYLAGVYDSVAQLHLLSSATLAAFDSQFPSDRWAEPSAAPPDLARRVRMYLDRARGLTATADAYVARAVEGKGMTVTRIAEDPER